jgi:hypothetical protein
MIDGADIRRVIVPPVALSKMSSGDVDAAHSDWGDVGELLNVVMFTLG